MRSLIQYSPAIFRTVGGCPVQHLHRHRRATFHHIRFPVKQRHGVERYVDGVRASAGKGVGIVRSLHNQNVLAC